MKKLLTLLVVLAMVSPLLVSCAGVRTGKGTYVAHATAFHFFSFKIPADALEMAEEQVPANAKTKQTIAAAPSDWTSVSGILNNILSFNCAAIGGEL